MTPANDAAQDKPHIHLPDGSCCKPKRFAHLHQHTQYSLLDGAAKLKDLLKWAKEVTPEGCQPALAMTDHGNMHGAVHFYNYAMGMEVKPIIGYEAYVVPGMGTRRDRSRAQDGEKGIFHLTLLARDFEGYQNLCRLSSRGYTEGYYYKPRIDHELLQEHHKGVIAFSGCLGSEVQQLLMQGREDEAKQRLLWYRDLFGENYYIEIQDHGLPEQKKNNPILKAWAQELGIGMVATNDGHYVKKSDATAHETLLAIQTKATLADENRFKFPCDEFYVKNLDEMQAALPVAEWGEEVFDNTAHIADLCDVHLPVGKKRVYQMPALPIPEGRTMAEELRVQTYAGAVKRYPAHLTEGLLREYAARSLTQLGDEDAKRVLARVDNCDAATCDLDTLYTLLAFLGSEWEKRGKDAGEKYTPYPALAKMEAEVESGPLPKYAVSDFCRAQKLETSDTNIDLDPDADVDGTTPRKFHTHALVLLRRAEYELSVINNMGFPDYFLIVADYINWAKDHDISVGPGRGSGAGSLVAYAIRITNLDPLEFELLFERFLNPDRISMPDFDIDFNDARRIEVIEYVRQKYGDDKVAMIATFGTMASKACLKDVARVMSLEYAKVDKVSKLIPIKFGKSYSLEQAREAVPDIQQMLAEDAQLLEAYEFAQKLEGLTRHASVHAAGVVIGKNQLTDLVPVMRDTSGEGIVCQYDMKAVEDIGLIKMDFLGLRTLSFLDEAKRILRESGADFDAKYNNFDNIPFDDAKTYELMSRGDTKGVFQLEGAGIADASRRLKPRRLADIIALSALYRPGPMENIPTYVRRHHGLEEVDYVRDGFPNSAQWLEKILKETYGIPVYQEQIMQIASEVAGYSLGGADLLRRCLAEGTLILNADTGERIPIEQVEPGMNVLSLGPDYAFYRVPVQERMDNGVQDVYRVRTRSGRSIEVTQDHPLLTIEGWRHLSDLKVGDAIAAPIRQSVGGSTMPDEHRARVLALLVGDGNTFTNAGGGQVRARFYSKNEELLTAFTRSTKALGAVTARDIHPQTGVTTVRCVAPAGGSNPITALIREVGLDKLAHEKRIPAEVFTYTTDSLKRFLSDLWSTDGSIESTRISYASSSLELIQDISHLLLRLGIVSMRRQSPTYRRTRYELVITDQDDVRRFQQELGHHLIAEKRQRLEKLLREVNERQRNQSIYQLPVAVTHRVRQAKERSGRTWAEAGEAVGIPGSHLSSGLNFNEPRRALSRHRVQRLGQAFQSEELQQIASSDVLWDDIIDIQPAGQKRVYDLAVPPFANFVAADLIVHNSMGKKDKAEMERQRILFVEGSGKKGVPKEEANHLFDLLEKFADYGFNKSHSAAYGVITYQTAWLKANYPVQFMAALLTVERRDSDKVAEYVSDARKMDLHVLPPDINRSSSDFAVQGEEILFGLYAIKGLGEAAVQKVLEERERGGRFKSLADFCSRVGNKAANRKALESLIKSGAFDQFGERNQLLQSLDDALEDAAGAADINAKAQSGMSMMFGMEEVKQERPLRSGIPPFTDLERLKIEKEALGLYISGHPLEEHEGLREAASCRISDLDTWFQGQNAAPGKRLKAVLAGMIEGVVKKPTKSGGMMARFILADESGQTELVAFSRAYDRIQEKLVNDTPALVIVELESEDGGLRAIAEEVVSIEQLGEVPKVMYVTIDLETASPDSIGEFQSVLDEHAGSMPTYLRLETPEQFVIYQLDHAMGSQQAMKVLNETFPWANAHLAYDQQTILGRFAPKPPAWMNRQGGNGGGMRA